MPISFQVNISFAIIMCLDGFFPHDDFGFAAEIFSNPAEALPVITFVLSVIASAFGISKFYVIGPLRLISRGSPLSSMLSLSFLVTLFLNFGFVFRIYAIEHSLFSEYLMSSGNFSYEEWGITVDSISPVLPHEYRLIFYLIPVLPSMLFNILSLYQSLNIISIFKLFLHFPQYLITSCFVPLIFKGVVDEDQRKCRFKIKVHKLGTILNSIYIIFIPQVMLVISDYLRGVLHWEFTSSTNKFFDAGIKGDLETNSGMTKHPLGNIFVSISVCASNLVVLLLLFWKSGNLFVQESDVLGSRNLGQEHWNICWARKEHPKNETSEMNNEKVLRIFIQNS